MVFKEITVVAILERMAGGESVLQISKDERMPSRSTIMLWVAQDKGGFAERYQQACIARAHFWADEILDIADDSTNDYITRQNKNGDDIEVVNTENIQRSRLRVDARKWILSKMLPQFSDKGDNTPDETDPVPHKVIIEVQDARKPEESEEDDPTK